MQAHQLGVSTIFKWFLSALILAGLLTLLPYVAGTRILEGQIGKQTFSAEMAQSYSRGELAGFFPLRHFLEIYHPDVVPWAEEFPLYTAAIGYLNRWTGAPLIPLGRALSFGFFLLLLVGAHELGRRFDAKLDQKVRAALALPFIFAWFPVFRTYSVSFMPDLPMAALCLWGIVLAWDRKWGRCAAVMCVAALFKYFAVFTTLGLMLYAWFSEKDRRSALRASFLLGLSALPSVAYVAWFLLLGIPNPITEYRSIDGHGHLASLHSFADPKMFLRMGTWLLVKNPSLAGAVLFLVGVGWFLPRKVFGESRALLGWLALSGLLLPIVFAHGFYVHDYYGIQLSILTAIFAAIGLGAVVSLAISPRISAKVGARGGLVVFAVATAALATAGFLMTRSTLVPQIHYAQAAEALRARTLENERILMISDLSQPVVLFQAGRIGWMIEPRNWERKATEAEERLRDPRVAWVIVYLMEPWVADNWGWISAKLKAAQWKEVESLSFVSVNRKVPTTRMRILRREG